LLIATHSCDFKCLKEQNLDLSICQNSHLTDNPTKQIGVPELIDIFNNNLLSDCVVFAGMEPMLQFEEIYNFIRHFRESNNDDIVLFTGYYPDEIEDKIERLKEFSNIVVKFGRFIENSSDVYDKTLGISLASKNQFAKKIS